MVFRLYSRAFSLSLFAGPIVVGGPRHPPGKHNFFLAQLAQLQRDRRRRPRLLGRAGPADSVWRPGRVRVCRRPNLGSGRRRVEEDNSGRLRRRPHGAARVCVPAVPVHNRKHAYGHAAVLVSSLSGRSLDCVVSIRLSAILSTPSSIPFSPSRPLIIPSNFAGFSSFSRSH